MESWLQARSLEGYDSMAPPKESSGNNNPVVVSVGLNVFKIVDIDIKSATMSVSAWIRMTWSDKRLAWNDTETPVVQLAYYASNDREQTQIWVPDIELYNQKQSLYTFADKPAQVWSSGSMFWSRPGELEILCAFQDLSQHPFDQTECTFELGGWAKR